VSRINEVKGRFPGLYSGNLIKEKLGGKPADPVPLQCFLWIAPYGPAATNIPATWPTWTFWQYTDGNVGPQPHSVDGIGKCDSPTSSNGKHRELEKLWELQLKPPVVDKRHRSDFGSVFSLRTLRVLCVWW